MASLTATLLFAALASAQTANITTTAWMIKFAGSDKYGYVASVMGADAQHMTLSMDFDADTDKDALHIGGEGGNFTFGLSDYTVNWPQTRFGPTPSGDMNVQIQCTQPAQSGDEVSYTEILGDGFARFISCNEYQTTQTDRPQYTNSSTVYPHTYGTGLWGSGGTETITMNFTYPLQTETTTPAWCTSDDVPASVLTIADPSPAESFAVYQIVITAGQEKLSAYSGSLVAVSTASGSTGNVPVATPSAGSGAASASATASAPPVNTGAADRISAVVPALAGMGVAAVMGVL
jgi:hypothetical protein